MEERTIRLIGIACFAISFLLLCHFIGWNRLAKLFPRITLPWRMITIGLVFWFIATFLVYTFTFWLFNWIAGKSHYALIVAIPLGAWAAAWFFLKGPLPFYEWMSLNVKPNWAIVLGNLPKGHQMPLDESERTEMYEMASLREVLGPASSDKWPWEEPVEMGGINTQSERVIGNPDDNQLPIIIYNQDKIGYKIRWQIRLRSLPGYHTNLIRHTEESTNRFFESEAKQHIFAHIAPLGEDDMFKLLGEQPGVEKSPLKSSFENLFGGPKKLHEYEKEYGMYTGTPEIISVERSENIQEAIEGIKLTDMYVQSVNKLKKEGVDPDVASIIVAQIMGLEGNLNPIMFVGLKGIDPAVAQNALLMAQHQNKAKGGKKS